MLFVVDDSVLQMRLQEGLISGMRPTLYHTPRSLVLLPAESHHKDWELGQEGMHGAMPNRSKMVRDQTSVVIP